MLRGKALKFSRDEVQPRDKILSATQLVGNIAGIPVVSIVVNAVNKTTVGRKLLDKALGVHPDAPIPTYYSRTYRSRHKKKQALDIAVTPTPETTGKVALFVTCYGNRNEPDLGSDLRAVYEYNGIPVVLAQLEACCGMPKLELGDLNAIEQLKNINIPALIKLVDQGYDIVTPIPSCTLMFKQELRLLFPDDKDVQRIAAAMFDPFEYLWLRHKQGLLRTDFKTRLGKISYHVACHLRVQNIGLKTRDVLKLVPDTQVEAIERCSGHNGTYGVKREFRDISMKIGRPVFSKVEQSNADFYSSDCPMAGHQIQSGLDSQQREPTHPLKLLRKAYGI
jgi:Fe-S oxidoreductase